jgi:hypothetical protein
MCVNFNFGQIVIIILRGFKGYMSVRGFKFQEWKDQILYSKNGNSCFSSLFYKSLFPPLFHYFSF